MEEAISRRFLILVRRERAGKPQASWEIIGSLLEGIIKSREWKEGIERGHRRERSQHGFGLRPSILVHVFRLNLDYPIPAHHSHRNNVYMKLCVHFEIY